MSIVSIILALLIFSLIVIFHELGHFLLAKRGGIRVNEFSLGMGPTLLSKQIGETRYCLKLLPFGGSCMMEGEDGDYETEEEAGGEALPQAGAAYGAENRAPGEPPAYSFGAKSVWTRISVVAAGPIFNFILAFFLALFIIGSIGYDEPVLVDVMEGYAAEEAGMQAGDRIVRMNDKKVPRTDMDQIHLPDPVLDDIRKLQQENIRLHGELRRLVKEIRCVERKGDYDEDL